MAWVTPIPTRWGEFTATFTKAGLAELRFPPSAVIESPPAGAVCTHELPQSVTRWVERTRRAVEQVLRGEPSKGMPPLDWAGAGTPFQQRVWTELCRIPTGETVTYGELARRVGRPGAARAVGQACGANPIPVLVPCHRVLAAGGGLGGFSAGLDWKRRLLAVEQPASSFSLRS